MDINAAPSKEFSTTSVHTFNSFTVQKPLPSMSSFPSMPSTMVAPKVYMEPIVLRAQQPQNRNPPQKAASMAVPIVAPPRNPLSFAPPLTGMLPTNAPQPVIHQARPIEVVNDTSSFPTVTTPPPWPPPFAAELLPPVQYKFYGPKESEAMARFGNFGMTMPMASLESSPAYTPMEAPTTRAFAHEQTDEVPASEAFADLAAFDLPADSESLAINIVDSAPGSGHGLEAQLQELLDGQRSIMEELYQVKEQVNSNHNELEVLRQCSQPAQAYDPVGLQDYYQQFQQPDMQQGCYQDDYMYRQPEPMDGRQMRFPNQMPAFPDPRLGSSMALTNLGYDDSMDKMSLAMKSVSAQVSDGARTLHSQLKQRSSLGGRGFGSFAGGIGSRSKGCC